ncbi:hypothetical protein, partial [Mycobacterium sp. NPDC004974]
SEKSDQNKRHQQTGIKKTNNHTLNGKKSVAKKQQTKTTKHTIEFSNNRLYFFAALFWGNLTSLIKSLWLVKLPVLACFIRTEATPPA